MGRSKKTRILNRKNAGGGTRPATYKCSWPVQKDLSKRSVPETTLKAQYAIREFLRVSYSKTIIEDPAEITRMDTVEEYKNSCDLQRQDSLDIIEEFSDEIANMNGRCIDIGCGPGTVTKDLLLSRLPSDAVIVGADISKVMIDYAKKNYKDVERLSFIQMDIQAEELPNKEIGQYDNVFSFYCLHWCQNTRQTYENIYKLLRPGGKSLIMFLSFNDGFYAYTKLRDNPRYKAYMEDAGKYVPPFHNNPNPRATLKKILKDVGFEVLHCSNREKSFIYKNLKILQNHSMAVNPFYKRMPDYLKEEYQEEMMRELIRYKIIFENKNSKVPNEYSVLDRYRLLIAYFKKPEI